MNIFSAYPMRQITCQVQNYNTKPLVTSKATVFQSIITPRGYATRLWNREELQYTFRDCGRLFYRMCKNGNIDFLWRKDEQWSAGILSRMPKP